MTGSAVIGIVGLQASGKTEVASRMSELGAARVRMGNLVWNEVERRGLELSEGNVAKIANELREEEGRDAIAKRCIPLIKEEVEADGPVVVDGIRGVDEVRAFEKEFGDEFVLVWVKAPEEDRYGRIRDRKREDDTTDLESFRKKDERELSWGLEEAMESAEYTIVNEGSLKELISKTDEVFEKVMNNDEVSG